MAWKMKGEGVLELVNGNPVWVTDTGEEKPVDYPAMSKRLADVNRESAERKEKLRGYESRYAALQDIEDFPAWLEETTKAREMAAHAGDNQKAVEEQIQLRVDAASRPLKEKLAAASKELEGLRANLQAEKVSNAFARSEYVQKNLISAAMAADLFSGRFRLKDDGALEAVDDHGKTLYGAEGVATFDEAIMHFVNASPYKAVLLKGTGGTGSGGNPSAGGGLAGMKNPFTKESWNLTEQHKLFKENPDLYRSLKEAAGQ